MNPTYDTHHNTGQPVAPPSMHPQTPAHEPHTVQVTYATPTQPTNTQPNPIGLAGGILGIVVTVLGLFLGWLLPFIVAPLAIVAIALSAEGIRRANRYGLQKGWSVAGLSTAIPSLVLSSTWLIILILAAVTGA